LASLDTERNPLVPRRCTSRHRRPTRSRPRRPPSWNHVSRGTGGFAGLGPLAKVPGVTPRGAGAKRAAWAVAAGAAGFADGARPREFRPCAPLPHSAVIRAVGARRAVAGRHTVGMATKLG
jgi:hypothetical protein